VDPDQQQHRQAPQGLEQLSISSQDSSVTDEIICGLIEDEYFRVGRHNYLEVLILDRRLRWSPACGSSGSSGCCLGANIVNVVSVLDYSEDFLEASPLEPHELLVMTLLAADNVETYAAIFDVHREQRTFALESIRYTTIVVVLLMGLVMYFATDMKKLSNSNVLHPLWVLMDDMCALKSIEVMTENQSYQHVNITAAYGMLTIGGGNGIGRCRRLLSRSSKRSPSLTSWCSSAVPFKPFIRRCCRGRSTCP